MSALTQAVHDLSEFSTYLHREARRNQQRDCEDYFAGAGRAYGDAAARLDELNIGPVMQAVLDELDANTPGEGTG